MPSSTPHNITTLMKALRILSLTAAIAGLAVAGRANPVMLVYDHDSGDTEVVVGSGNTVSFNGTIGDWIVNVSSGAVVQGGSSPVLTLSSVGISDGDGIDLGGVDDGMVSLSVFLFASGFGSSDGLTASTMYDGVTSGTASYFVFQNNTNNTDYFGTFYDLADFLGTGSFGPGAFSHSSSAALVGPASLYSLALGIQIDHGVGLQQSSVRLNVSVPDQGMTALLLAFGLLGLGLTSRRLKV
jgi:hypothetical protein